MVEPIEARFFELPQPIGNDAAPSTQAGREGRAAMDAETVRQQVPAAKRFGVCDHLVELQPDRRVVGGDDGAGADADNGVQRHAVPHELLEDPGVRGAAQASGAEHDTDAHAFLLVRARILQPRAHLFIGRSRRDERNLGGSCSS